MSQDDSIDPKWKRVSKALRETGAGEPDPSEDREAPHGFSTRVTALYQADLRAEAAGWTLWRRAALTGATCAFLLFGGGFLVSPPEAPVKPIIPVPEMDNWQSSSSQP